MLECKESARLVPVRAEVDVLVCGAGPAGFAAAVSAARSGAKTLLLEQTGTVGGIATAGLMSHWTGSSEGPLFNELLTRADDTAGCEIALDSHHVTDPRHIINPEKLKLAMLEILSEAGVILQLYTFMADAWMDGETIRGVITESKSGREAIAAKVVIDATGDGDVACKAGADFVKGREGDGRMQPVTVMFKVAGVDEARAVFPGGFESMPELQAIAREHLPAPAGHVLLYRTTLPGVVSVNMTNMINIDGTDVRDLTRGEIACRQQIPLIEDFLRKHVPGFEKCYVISSSSLLGVRETRHFKGEYTVTADDILAARQFEDWIATRCFFNFDIHSLDGPGLDKDGAQQGFAQQRKYTIPYRACLPLKIEGLLLAGRNISGTHKAHSNYRVMPICLNMGQGVGTAAALAALADVTPRQVDILAVQARLIQQGVQPGGSQ
jgi:ribulose 1,5-bisphosphate synthetase/thiazole synthase